MSTDYIVSTIADVSLEYRIQETFFVILREYSFIVIRRSPTVILREYPTEESKYEILRW